MVLNWKKVDLGQILGEEMLYCESIKTLEQAAQRDWECPILEAFKATLTGTQSNLVQKEVSLPTGGGLELDDLKGTF